MKLRCGNAATFLQSFSRGTANRRWFSTAQAAKPAARRKILYASARKTNWKGWVIHELPNPRRTPSRCCLLAAVRRSHDHRTRLHVLDEPQYENGNHHQRRTWQGFWPDVCRRSDVPEPLHLTGRSRNHRVCFQLSRLHPRAGGCSRPRNDRAEIRFSCERPHRAAFGAFPEKAGRGPLRRRGLHHAAPLRLWNRVRGN